MKNKKHYIRIECLSNEEQVHEDKEEAQQTSEEPAELVARDRQPPNFYGIRVNLTTEVLNKPASMTEALSSSDSSKMERGNGKGDQVTP